MHTGIQYNLVYIVGKKLSLSAEHISLLAVNCGVVSAESADWGSLMGSCAPLSRAVWPLLVCALLVLAVYEDIFP